MHKNLWNIATFYLDHKLHKIAPLKPIKLDIFKIYKMSGKNLKSFKIHIIKRNKLLFSKCLFLECGEDWLEELWRQEEYPPLAIKTKQKGGAQSAGLRNLELNTPVEQSSY